MTKKKNDAFEFLSPKIRLFLSADLIGSTALKQAVGISAALKKDGAGFSSTHSGWISPILFFYREFTKLFFTSWDDERKKYEKRHETSAIRERPFLWKSAGDELIFCIVLETEDSLFLSIYAWMSAIRAYRERTSVLERALDVKSAVWVAGFPVLNQEVALPNEQFIFKDEVSRVEGDYTTNLMNLQEHYRNIKKSNWKIDFIGPSIDTGFRLAKFADSRRIIISVELSNIMARCSLTKMKENDICIYFDGMVELKGVVGGEPYPIFWIDVSSNKYYSESLQKITRSDAISLENLEEFTKAFIDEHKKYLFLPFINGALNPDLRAPPANYRTQIEHIAETLKKEMRKESDLEKSLANVEVDPDEVPKHQLNVSLPKGNEKTTLLIDEDGN